MHAANTVQNAHSNSVMRLAMHTMSCAQQCCTDDAFMLACALWHALLCCHRHFITCNSMKLRLKPQFVKGWICNVQRRLQRFPLLRWRDDNADEISKSIPELLLQAKTSAKSRQRFPTWIVWIGMSECDNIYHGHAFVNASFPSAPVPQVPNACAQHALKQRSKKRIVRMQCLESRASLPMSCAYLIPLLLQATPSLLVMYLQQEGAMTRLSDFPGAVRAREWSENCRRSHEHFAAKSCIAIVSSHKPADATIGVHL
eukprot:1137220-Pelagomonas_calceolata.AAC.1